ncbi:MAG: HAMP domain-containing protein [Caldilinea sp. CFX5]|nr:HAMP domain-containing protein [Caldilinea sp. CFX5]
MLFYKSLQGRMMVALVSVTLLSIVSLGLVAFWRERAALENQLSDELTSSVEYTKQRLRDWLRERQSDVHFLAADDSNRASFSHLLDANTPPAQEQLHRSRLTASLVSMQQARPEYQRILLADTTGTIIVAADPSAVGRKVQNAAAFSQTLALATTTPLQGYIEDISYDERLGKYIMCFGYPLLAPAADRASAKATPAEALGVVLIVVDVETTVFRILEEWSKGDSGTAVLSRAEGDKTRILNQVLKDPARPLERVLPPPADPAHARPAYWAARGDEDMRLTIDHLQVEVLTVYRYIEEMQWGLVLKMDTSEIFAPLHDLVRHVTYITLGVLAVALLVSILIARTLTRPLADLVANARAVAAGQTPVYTTLQRQDEIGLLARSFREMVDTLRHQQQQLKAANEVAGGILSLRPVDEILQDVVQAAQRLTGATAAQFKVAPATNQPAVRVIQSQRLTDDRASVIAVAPPLGNAPLLTKTKHQERRHPLPPVTVESEPEKATVEMRVEAPHLFNGKDHTAMPIYLQDNGLGTLWVQKAADQPFSAADNDTLQALTTYAAVALANARLVQRLQSWNSELEQKVEERTRRLEEANQQLLVLDKMKSDLLYSISHELRNPISNLKLQLDLLHHHIDSPRREKYLGMLANQINMLGNLVTDMLELIRIDGTQDQFVFTSIDFNHLVADVVRACSIQLQETTKPIALHFTPDPAPLILQGEQKHLALAITHLLRNAINFTNAGEITVTLKQEEMGVCLQIKDTGIGIAENDLPHIFERFYRGTNVSQSTIPGSGLGLSVAEKIILLHKGRVLVQSTLGQGSTFGVWLPLASDREIN